MEFACKESTKSLQKFTRVVKEGNIKKYAMYTLLITKSNVHCTSYLSPGNLLLTKRVWTYFGGKVVRQKPEFTPKNSWEMDYLTTSNTQIYVLALLPV